MTTHTDANKLVSYRSSNYPNIDGQTPRYFTNEHQAIEKAIDSLIAVVKLLEARMNSNGLT